MDHANAIVSRTWPSNVEALVPEVDALIANEPSFGEAAAADGIVAARELGLPALDHPLDPTDLDARGEAIMNVLFGLETPDKVARACPATASFAACLRGLSRPLHVARKSGTSRSIILQALFESTTAHFTRLTRVEVARRVIAHGKLIGLRLQLEVLRAGCDSPLLATLAASPMLGDSMGLERVGSTLVVSAPAWVPRSELMRISCAR